MREIWKPVVGFETSHEVSSRGRVRSLCRRFIGGRTRLDGSPSTMTAKGRVLSVRINKRGYAVVDISDQQRRRGRVVHKVVAEAFIGPAPSIKHEVNHLDGNKLNNCVENLEWCTPKENSQHAYDTGLKVPMRGTQHSTAKLDEQKVREVRTLLAHGMSQRAIARIFGVTNPQIHRIAAGKSWVHVV